MDWARRKAETRWIELAFAEDGCDFIESGDNGGRFGLCGVEASGEGLQQVVVVLIGLQEIVIGRGLFPHVAVGFIQSREPAVKCGWVKIGTGYERGDGGGEAVLLSIGENQVSRRKPIGNCLE